MKLNNKKGFTLVELILVLVILGVILIFSLPNITKSLENRKKNQFIIDAKDMVERAKIKRIKTGYKEEYCTPGILLGNLYSSDELSNMTSSLGNSYDTNSYVKICKESNKYIYEIVLKDSEGNGIISRTNWMELEKESKYDNVSIANK